MLVVFLLIDLGFKSYWNNEFITCYFGSSFYYISIVVFLYLKALKYE